MNVIRKTIRPRLTPKGNGKFLLIFLNGILLASLFYIYIEKEYENTLFKSLATYLQTTIITDSSQQHINIEDSLLQKSVHLVYTLTKQREEIFSPYPADGLKAMQIHPVSVDLMTGQGACGSYAYTLGRLLQELNFQVRFPQMTVNNQDAGHILVEAKASYGWVVLDASNNLFFNRPDAKLAGFNDVKNNWNYYQAQVPSGYNMAYRYEGVRYTNWDKIPVLMPLIKNIMYMVKGKEATNSYSFRSMALKKYNFMFNLTLAAYLLVILFSINLILKARRKAFSDQKMLAGKGQTSTPVDPAI